jgi:hypothetical protein
LRYLLLFTLFIICGDACAQVLHGRVTDKATKLPVNGALVTLGTKQTFTNSFGDFSIPAARPADTLKVMFFGYKPYKMVVVNSMEAIHIELEAAKIALNEVTIHANRQLDFKKDSSANRGFYAKEFNYKAPKVTDAFVPAASAANNTSQLLTIDVITLVRALTKKSTREYKFNKLLLRDEQTAFVGQKFNRGIVSRVTGLKGDTLLAFVVKYRPTYQFTRKATDYDMELYIKACYKKFLKEGLKRDELFLGKEEED